MTIGLAPNDKKNKAARSRRRRICCKKLGNKTNQILPRFGYLNSATLPCKNTKKDVFFASGNSLQFPNFPHCSLALLPAVKTQLCEVLFFDGA